MKTNFTWVQHPSIQIIINALTLKNNITFQFVGGCVRDSILGLKPKDLDLASILTPYENMQLLTKNNIKVVPYAINYGTIIALINNFTFEITTLRKDTTTFGRKANIKLINNYENDAKRRDFTFNAIYLHPLTYKLTDFFNGIHDLKIGKVKFIGNPNNRINEDYLRILRFVRFYTYFGKIKFTNIEKNIITHNAKKLSLLSKERITIELNKIINHKNFSKGIKALNEFNISLILFNQPKLHYRRLSILNNLSIKNKEKLSIILKWLSLIKTPQNLTKYITITKKETKYVYNIIKISSKLHSNHKASYFLTYFKSNIVIDSILLSLTKTNRKSKNYTYLTTLLIEVKQKQNFNFIITGKDLLSLKLPTGSIIGKILLQLKEWGIENNIQDKQLYLKKAKELI